MPGDTAHTPIESTAAAYWVMLRRIALAAAAIDIAFLLLYGLLGATALALLNLASIAMYAAAWWLLHLRKNVLGVLLMWFEVLAHAAAGSLLLGWEADFHLFLLLFVPVIVVGVPHRLAIPLMAVLLAFYAGLYMACRAWAPLSPLPPVHFEIARWFNIVLVFGLFYGVAAFYRQRVRAAESATRRLARIDALTGLSNRAHFQERAAAELSRARREGRPLTVMLADVDHFKVVNDTHGHDAGDLVLAAVARTMASTLREHDLLARWGGEEFMALLPATPGDEACAVAERVRQAVASTTVVVDGRSLSVTLSFGLAEVLAGDLHGATRRADEALYASKRAGRNRLTNADDSGAPPAPGAPAAGGEPAHDDCGPQANRQHKGVRPP
jgi:diguanylate cyclase (GGDEF)-like protein